MTDKMMTEKLKITLDYEQLTNCMRCGFCLPACPTFQETGIEAESPRGRLALMKAVADGIVEADRSFEDQMNHCLGCRACEPACPADVQYGHLLEQARDAIEDHTRSHRWWVKHVRSIAFKRIFPKQGRMKLLGGAISLYQKSGLQRFARRAGMLKWLPAHLREMEQILPEASYAGVVEKIGIIHPAKGEKIATVGLFRGCIMDVLFTETNLHTVELLTTAGFEVVIPKEQNCCGALHAHSGERKQAQRLAMRNIEVFQQSGVDYIVTNAGGCGALLIEYDQLLSSEEGWQHAAKWFAKRVIDISELLVRLGRIPKFSGEGVRMTYQDSCHLRNVMHTSDAPRQLMRRVEGAEYIEMKDADRCCGSAGIYNLTQPEMSGQILDRKMGHAKQTKAHVLLTSNPGCLLQMKLGIERHQLSDQMQAEHLVDFLHRQMKREVEG